MRQAPAVLIPFLLILGGCLSAPIPQELVDVAPIPPPEQMTVQDIVRLSRVGLSDEVIAGLIHRRGVADRPSLSGVQLLGEQGVSTSVQLAIIAAYPVAAAPEHRIVYRELFIPLWPVYSRGRWHLGCRIGMYTRTVEEATPKAAPKEPKPADPLPQFVDP